eukprot:3169893-Pleurochrysis_carterae.AAC.1
MGKALLPGWALSLLLLPVCSFSPDSQMQQLLSSIPVPFFSLTPSAVARILATLSSCGFFSAPVSLTHLRSRLAEALNMARTSGCDASFTLSALDITSSFSQPANQSAN